MFKVTKSAAKQIKASSAAGDMEELGLRIAAERAQDGSINYQMGFDEVTTDDIKPHLIVDAAVLRPLGGINYQMGFDEVTTDDIMVNSSGVDIIISRLNQPLLQGATMDFVEIEPGQERFIFLNPNDPSFVPPTEE